MDIIRPESIMQDLASQFVVHNRNIIPNAGILMTLEIHAENHGYERNGNTFHKSWRARYLKYLHYIVVKEHSVFVAISDEFDWRNISLKEWSNTSNHDSCWRSDGFHNVFPEIMKAYHACYDHIPKKHQPIPCMANISGSISPRCKSPITFVSVIKKKSEENTKGYYSLKAIIELNPKFPALEHEVFFT
jgi:hypothetical protein